MRIIAIDQDKIYAAGFFDGEGHVGISSTNGYSRKYYQVMTRVSQKPTAVLVWLQDRWEGNIYTHTNNKNQTWSEWTLFTAKARTFLADIQPYLIVKKDQVDYVLLAANRTSRPSLSLTEEDKLELQRIRVATS